MSDEVTTDLMIGYASESASKWVHLHGPVYRWAVVWSLWSGRYRVCRLDWTRPDPPGKVVWFYTWADAIAYAQVSARMSRYEARFAHGLR